MENKKLMNVHQEYTGNQEEVEKLRLENLELKKNLENEEFLHKTLYKQWNESNARVLAKERELKQFKKRNLFYKYAFYIILFSVVPTYYFLNSGNGNKKIVSDSQTVPSPPSTPKQTDNQTTGNETTSNQTTPKQTKTKRDTNTVKLPVVDLQKKDTIQLKAPIINKSVIVKQLTDSLRNLIYSQGWDAYYEKSGNPYQKSPQKYKVWLEGWKDAENDDKRMISGKVNDTGKNP